MIIFESKFLTKLVGICILLSPKNNSTARIKLAKVGPKTIQITQIPSSTVLGGFQLRKT